MTTSTPYRRGRKVFVSIQLDPDQCDDVDQIAATRRTSRSAVVREAVDFYLAKNNSDPDTHDSSEQAAA